MNFFIGIDQTGAALSPLEARPLPFAFIDARTTPRVRTVGLDGRPLRLARFSRDAVETLLVENGVDDAHSVVRSAKTAFMVDCVFGLANSLRYPPGAETFRQLFAAAAARTDGYGLKPAAAFFDDVLKRAPAPSRERFPVRLCEIIAKANSVFRTHPFQKNIQCGTYRIWRDLGLHGSDWVHLRYFEKEMRERPFLFESYPSLFWRELFGLRTRDRRELEGALKKHGAVLDRADLELMIENPDHADAGVLAIGGLALAREGKLFDGPRSRSRKLAREGWIVGLPRAKNY